MSRKPVLYGDRSRWGLIEADALLMLAKLPDACVDSIVCDPPYGIDFAGEAWDGADIRHASHAVREGLGAGEAFERWTAVWAAQCRRVLKPGGHMAAFGAPRTFHRLVCGVEDAGLEVRDQLLWLYGQGLPKSRKLPNGMATTLKPAFEPIVLARAPLTGRTTDNLARFGTGALNIDATRIVSPQRPVGYWPAHLVLSHAPNCRAGRCASDCPIGLLDDFGDGPRRSRFFYCSKASRAEREAGCEHLPHRASQLYTGSGRPARIRANVHPTVKPVGVLRWLTRLVTPPGGMVLDPFAGSGSTGIAALREGRQFLGIEREREYIDIACARLAHWAHESEQECA